MIHRTTLIHTFRLFLVCGLFYAVTQNPYTNPVIEIDGHNYTIEKSLSPLILGIAAHNYLTLRDETGRVIYELHGLPFDSYSLTTSLTAITPGYVLHVTEINGSLSGNPSARKAGKVVWSGSEENARRKWQEARTCGEEINDKRIPYPPFGISLRERTINSNTVANDLLTCMGLTKPHVGLFTPGAKSSLLH